MIQSLPVKQHSIDFHTCGTRTEMIEDYEKFYFLYQTFPLYTPLRHFATFLWRTVICTIVLYCTYIKLKPNSWTKSRQKSSAFSSLLFTVTSTALPWAFYFLKLTQPLTVSTVQLLYTVKDKVEKPERKPYPPFLWFRNTYRNLKSENSQDCAQKPQRNCTFMNLASGQIHIKPISLCTLFM